MTLYPNTQDPNDPSYQFINKQSYDKHPVQRDSSLSHFTIRQFTPVAITNTLPIVVTIPNHGFINGEAVRATKFITIPFALATGMEQLNNLLFYVQQATTNTFELYDVKTQPVDGRSFTPYISGGQFTLTGPLLPIVNPSHFPPPGYLLL
jgi:hypothetical protein